MDNPTSTTKNIQLTQLHRSVPTSVARTTEVLYLVNECPSKNRHTATK